MIVKVLIILALMFHVVKLDDPLLRKRASHRTESIQTTLSPTEGTTIHRNSPNDLRVLSAAVISEKLMIITKSFYVYEMPNQMLERSINEIYLISKPVLMKYKWPKLYFHKQFQKIKNRILDSFTLTDSYSSYLLFTTRFTTGVTYDLKHDKVYIGITYDGVDNRVSLLSTYTSMGIYSLMRRREGLYMVHFKVYGKYVTKIVKIMPDSGFYPICDRGNNHIEVVRDENSSCPRIQWPAYQGFKDEKNFYLFGPTYVIVFPILIFKNPTNPNEKSVVVQYTKVEFKNYNSTNKTEDYFPIKLKPLRFEYILGGIGLICFVILVLAIMMHRTVEEEEQEEKQNQIEYANKVQQSKMRSIPVKMMYPPNKSTSNRSMPYGKPNYPSSGTKNNSSWMSDGDATSLCFATPKQSSPNSTLAINRYPGRVVPTRPIYGANDRASNSATSRPPSGSNSCSPSRTVAKAPSNSSGRSSSQNVPRPSVTQRKRSLSRSIGNHGSRSIRSPSHSTNRGASRVKRRSTNQASKRVPTHLSSRANKNSKRKRLSHMKSNRKSAKTKTSALRNKSKNSTKKSKSKTRKTRSKK